MAKGVVRTDAPIEDKAKKYRRHGGGDHRAGRAARRARVPCSYTPLGVSNLLRFAVSALPERVERGAERPRRPAEGDAAGGAGRRARHSRGRRRLRVPRARRRGDGLPGRGASPRFAPRQRRPAARRAAAAASPRTTTSISSRDSVLTWRFAEAGSYVLTIEDVEHGGGKNGFAYRIYAGALPFVTAIFPLGVASGSVGDDYGRPASTSASAASLSVRGRSGGARRRNDSARRRPTPSGSALNRKARCARPLSRSARAEPNDDPGHRADARDPLDGQRPHLDRRLRRRRYGAAAPTTDVFRFTARKGQALVFEVTAQQLGSPLDSIIEVLDADGRPVPRAVHPRAGPDRDRAERSGLGPPQHPPRGVERDRASTTTSWPGDELLQVEAMPTHPDDDIRLKGFRGGRIALLDTSPRNHSVGEAVYKVEIHPPGARLEPNGMPVDPDRLRQRRRRNAVRRQGFAAALRGARRRRLLPPPAGRTRSRRRAVRLSSHGARAGAATST